MIKIPHSKTYMIQSSQLAIIQAFTALVVILNCWQTLKIEDNIYHVCIKCIFKSRNFHSFFERLIDYIGISRSFANQVQKKDLTRNS
jgi:hypothetical protein